MVKRKWIVMTCLCLVIFLGGRSGIVTEAKEKDTKVESVTEDMGSLLKELDSSEVKKLISFARDQVEKGNWDTQEGIDKAIEEGEKEFKISLTKEEKEKIHSVVKKIKGLRLSPEFILDQAEKIYEKYGKELTEDAASAGERIMDETKDKIQEEVKKSVKDYFAQMVGRVKGFFQGIFGK